MNFNFINLSECTLVITNIFKRSIISDKGRGCAGVMCGIWKVKKKEEQMMTPWFLAWTSPLGS